MTRRALLAAVAALALAAACTNRAATAPAALVDVGRTVTSLADSGPGTLRDALQAGGGQIGFTAGLRGTIDLVTPLTVPSDTTVDGTGADITIANRGIHLAGVTRVTIGDLNFAAITATSDEDAIQILGSTDVDVEHNTFTGVTDGSTDATQASTRIRVAWNRYVHTDKTSLLGAGGPNGLPDLVDITVDHNWYDGTNARAPMMRQGRFYVFNNLLDRPGNPDGTGYGARIACGANAWLVNNVGVGNGGTTRFLTTELEAQCDPTRAPAARVDGFYAIDAAAPISVTPDVVTWPDSANLPVPDPADDALAARIRAEAGHQPLTEPDVTTTVEPITTTSSSTPTTTPSSSTSTTTTNSTLPANVRLAKVGAGTLTLSWDPVAGADRYKWRLYTCAAGKLDDGTTQQTSTTRSGLGAGCYTATVQASIGGVFGPAGQSGQITL